MRSRTNFPSEEIVGSLTLWLKEKNALLHQSCLFSLDFLQRQRESEGEVIGTEHFLSFPSGPFCILDLVNQISLKRFPFWLLRHQSLLVLFPLLLMIFCFLFFLTWRRSQGFILGFSFTLMSPLWGAPLTTHPSQLWSLPCWRLHLYWLESSFSFWATDSYFLFSLNYQ